MPARVDPTPLLPGLSPVGGKTVQARFDGGEMSSDGGLLLLREVENRFQIADRLATCLDDRRDPERIVHSLTDIICFRMLMIAAGYEDGIDANSLRDDPLFKAALDRVPSDDPLCSQSTVLAIDDLSTGEPARSARPGADGTCHGRAV